MSDAPEDSSLENINIRHFKLSSGDDVIGIVVDPSEVEELGLDEALIVLSRPMRIEIVEKTDRTIFLFYNWQPVSKYPYCFINPSHVVSHTECDENTKHQYVSVAASVIDETATPDAIDDDLDEIDTDERITFMSDTGSNTIH
jgi:hypothetical protein